MTSRTRGRGQTFCNDVLRGEGVDNVTSHKSST